VNIMERDMDQGQCQESEHKSSDGMRICGFLCLLATVVAATVCYVFAFV
jgi:hypothetical protein